MRRAIIVCLALLLCGPANAKKKSSIDHRLLSAQYVCIVSASGDDIDPRTQDQDRAAILRVESALKSWGRYHIVYNQEDADILLVVRTGNYARTGGSHGPVSTGTIPIPGVPGPTGSGTRIGGPPAGPGPQMDVSNVGEDMISVYDARTSLDHLPNTSVIWRATVHRGLSADPNGKVPLVEALKKDVESATPPPKP